MTNEIAIYDNGGMDLSTLGSVLAKSGYFQDTRDQAQAIVKVLAGRELGIGPIAAMTGVYIVSGRVAIGANLMAAAVKRSGKYNYRVLEHSDKVCRIAFYEGKEPIGESVFTLEDAKKAGTKNLDKFPRNMLFARAMSNGVRWYTPDVFDTAVYTPDELSSAYQAETVDVPPAPANVNVVTGEVVDDAQHARDLLVQDLRQAYAAAKRAGAQVDPPSKAEVQGWDESQIELAIDYYRAAAMESEARAEPDPDETATA